MKQSQSGHGEEAQKEDSTVVRTSKMAVGTDRIRQI